MRCRTFESCKSICLSTISFAQGVGSLKELTALLYVCQDEILAMFKLSFSLCSDVKNYDKHSGVLFRIFSLLVDDADSQPITCRHRVDSLTQDRINVLTIRWHKFVIHCLEIAYGMASSALTNVLANGTSKSAEKEAIT